MCKWSLCYFELTRLCSAYKMNAQCLYRPDILYCSPVETSNLAHVLHCLHINEKYCNELYHNIKINQNY
jgi:hypothetical protein